MVRCPVDWVESGIEPPTFWSVDDRLCTSSAFGRQICSSTEGHRWHQQPSATPPPNPPTAERQQTRDRPRWNQMLTTCGSWKQSGPLFVNAHALCTPSDVNTPLLSPPRNTDPTCRRSPRHKQGEGASGRARLETGCRGVLVRYVKPSWQRQ
ncbi:unnamed protein product [Pleuronectes platessa]|uniref:Uncharacterized protein n=1 Tax=Pleuronectes platessa TaxID=8262 RepID=A0A9N7VNZ0_PLEPL|nr:unnamed protein product [Pleuronectes platessa]